MKNITNYLALGAVALGLTGAAQAVPTIKIYENNVLQVTVTDGGAGDLSPLGGMVLVSANTPNFAVTIGTGQTKPLIGTQTAPQMDLNFVVTSVLGQLGGTIKFEFSETGFGPTAAGSLLAAIGGTSIGTVSYQAFVDNVLVTDIGPLTGQPFSGAATSGLINYPGSYTLTQIVSVTHVGGGFTTTGDASLNGVPDSGSTIALLGAALATLGLISRRRK